MGTPTLLAAGHPALEGTVFLTVVLSDSDSNADAENCAVECRASPETDAPGAHVGRGFLSDCR